MLRHFKISDRTILITPGFALVESLHIDRDFATIRKTSLFSMLQHLNIPDLTILITPGFVLAKYLFLPSIIKTQY